MESNILKKDILDKVPSEKSLERNFLFIKDDLLRQNISITLRYITFLTVLQDSMKIKGTIQYSIYKTIILYTASIVECGLLYCLKEYKKNGLIKDSDIMRSEWKYDVKSIYKMPDSIKKEEIIAGRRHEKFFNLTDNIQFKAISIASLKCEILNGILFKRVNDLRDNRNKIHLTGLREHNDYFSKKDINKAFTTSSRVLERVEEKLGKL